MYKECFIIILVLILVIGLDILTNNYTKKSVDNITSLLNELKEIILSDNKSSAKDKIKNIEDEWEKKDGVLAYYIEHDELEKVKTQITLLNADIDTKEYQHCIEYLDSTIFILEHIEEKEKFNIRSIF